jgi:hypothetical protein
MGLCHPSIGFAAAAWADVDCKSRDRLPDWLPVANLLGRLRVVMLKKFMLVVLLLYALTRSDLVGTRSDIGGAAGIMWYPKPHYPGGARV